MPSAGQATKLNDLNTTSVDLVTRGANRRRFALKKGDNRMTAQEALIEILKAAPQPGQEQDWTAIDKLCADAGIDPQGAETYKALVKLSAAYKDSPGMAQMVREHLTKLFSAGGGGDQPAPAQQDKPAPADANKPVPADGPPKDNPAGEKPAPPTTDAPAGTPASDKPTEVDGKEKPMSKTQDASAGAQQAADAGKTSAEELQKSIDAQVKAAVKEALEKSAADNQAIIKSMETKLNEQTDKALKAEWVSKAKDSLQGVPGKSIDELGAQLFDLEKKAGKEVADSQFEVLKSASAAVLKSAALNPAGFTARGAVATDDASAKIAAAAEKVSKSGGSSLSEAQAVRKALESDPALYAEYLNQHPGQRGRAEYAR